jgi:hypothetical protein
MTDRFNTKNRSSSNRSNIFQQPSENITLPYAVRVNIDADNSRKLTTHSKGNQTRNYADVFEHFKGVSLNKRSK